MSRPWPAGLLGMLLLVAPIEWYVARHDHAFGNVSAVHWRNARSMARKAKGCDVLCLGSSLTTNGVQPRVIADRIGKRACNLAVFAGPNVASYFLLKRALESGARPKVLVLDCQDRPVESTSPYEFPELRILLRLWPEVLTLPEFADLAWTARDASLFAALVVTRALPTARARFEIRASIGAALEGKSASLVLPIAGLLRNWRTHHGAQVLPARGQDQEQSDPLPPYPGRRELWTANRITETYTRRMMALASRHGIAVLWTFPPLGPRLTAWRRTNGLEAYETRFARDVQARTPRVTLVDGRRSQYPPRVFSDGLHLGRPGAVAYSRDLTAVLARFFEGPQAQAQALPKSVVLPAYRAPGPADDMALENIYESGDVVRVALLRRRAVVH